MLIDIRHRNKHLPRSYSIGVIGFRPEYCIGKDEKVFVQENIKEAWRKFLESEQSITMFLEYLVSYNCDLFYRPEPITYEIIVGE